MKALNLQDDIPSFPIDNFKDHYVLVFDLTSMQAAIENCHYPELVGEPLRLELNFIFPQEHVTDVVEMGELMFLIAADVFGVVGKIVQFSQGCSPAHFRSYLSTQVSLPWFNPIKSFSNFSQ